MRPRTANTDGNRLGGLGVAGPNPVGPTRINEGQLAKLALFCLLRFPDSVTTLFA